MWLIFRDVMGLCLGVVALLHLARIADALARIAGSLAAPDNPSGLRGFTDGNKWRAAQEAKERSA